MKGQRPSRPDLPDGGSMSSPLWDLVQSCWDQDRSERPAMKQTAKLLAVLTHSSPDAEVDMISQQLSTATVRVNISASSGSTMVAIYPGQRFEAVIPERSRRHPPPEPIIPLAPPPPTEPYNAWYRPKPRSESPPKVPYDNLGPPPMLPTFGQGSHKRRSRSPGAPPIL